MKKKMIMFKSPWCAPCKTMTPIVEELIAEGRDITIVDISEEPEKAAEYNIRSVPAMIVFKDTGLMTENAVGFRPKEALITMLEE